MRFRMTTPIGALLKGFLSGAAGTAAMDALHYHRSGGDKSFLEWDTAAGLKSWDEAPAPAQVGKRIVEGLLQRPLEPDKARLMTNIVHWGYGMAWGGFYGLLAGSARERRLSYGLPFGVLVWSTAYAVLPSTGLYKPIWEYDAGTLWKDAQAHLVYGLTTAAVFKLL